jgi:predicted ArsR family transcriptional regulator
MVPASGDADGETSDEDEELLALFEATYPSQPPLSTGEVAEHLDVDEETARERLESLKAADELASKSLTGGKKLWWRPEMDFATAELAGSPRQHVAQESSEE